MATYTENYNLEKPAQSDLYNVDVFNENADKIDEALGDKAENQSLAPIESSSTASRNYSVGQQFVYNGLLYEATAAIASGGTITPGSNCARTTVAEELSALSDSFTVSTSATVIDMNVAVSGDTAWHNTEQTIDYSAYKYLVVTCGCHGAVYNSIIVPKAILAITPSSFLRVSAFYDTSNQGCVEIYNTGRFHAFAKTQYYQFDVIVKGFK